jgi:hypothetical protein
MASPSHRGPHQRGVVADAQTTSARFIARTEEARDQLEFDTA